MARAASYCCLAKWLITVKVAPGFHPRNSYLGRMMIRIILPLAMAAAAFFGPWFVETSTGDFTGTKQATISGDYFVGATVDCFLAQNFSISGECAPNNGRDGLLMFGAVAGGVMAGVLGILGLLPFVGRLTSLFTIVAGAVGLAAVANFASTSVLADTLSFADLRWGAYGTGGLALITLLSGFGGLGGR